MRKIRLIHKCKVKVICFCYDMRWFIKNNQSKYMRELNIDKLIEKYYYSE